jgi:hypothetical protein
VSSSFNFVANRRLVFAESRGLSPGDCAARYFALVAAIMSVNYAAIHLLYERVGVALLPSKLLTEALLFFASYYVQKQFVFGRATPVSRAAPAVAPASAARARPAASVPAVDQEWSDEESMHESSGPPSTAFSFRTPPSSKQRSLSTPTEPKRDRPIPLRGR